MDISSPPPGIAAATPFVPRNPAGTRVAALVTPGNRSDVLQVADLLTGYGRPSGYNSLANARRAAYMLTRGEARGAAGIYQQGGRFFVRAMGSFTAGRQALAQLHVEGTTASLAGVQDPRLLMLVDGSTKLFSRR